MLPEPAGCLCFLHPHPACASLPRAYSERVETLICLPFLPFSSGPCTCASSCTVTPYSPRPALPRCVLMRQNERYLFRHAARAGSKARRFHFEARATPNCEEVLRVVFPGQSARPPRHNQIGREQRGCHFERTIWESVQRGMEGSARWCVRDSAHMSACVRMHVKRERWLRLAVKGGEKNEVWLFGAGLALPLPVSPDL